MKTILPLLSLVTALSVAGVQACGSSSDDGDLFTDAGGDGTTTSDTGTGSDVSTTPDTGTGADVSRAEAGDTGIPQNLDGGEAGVIPCVVGGVAEQEPNDTAPGNELAANTPTCGIITKDDASLDVDFFHYTIPQNVNTMTLQFFGDVKITISVELDDGGTSTTVLTPGVTNQPVPFVRGKQYSVKVESNSGQRVTYRLDLIET